MKIDIFLENSNQIQINLFTWKSILFLLQLMKEDGPELKSYDDHDHSAPKCVSWRSNQD